MQLQFYERGEGFAGESMMSELETKSEISNIGRPHSIRRLHHSPVLKVKGYQNQAIGSH